MSPVAITLLVIVIVLAIIIAVLYFLGKKAQKKQAEQQELLEPIRTVIERCLHCEASSLQVINRPPTRSKPLYMKVWEARKNDGLSYDPDDPEQNLYLAQITKYALRNID